MKAQATQRTRSKHIFFTNHGFLKISPRIQETSQFFRPGSEVGNRTPTQHPKKPLGAKFLKINPGMGLSKLPGSSNH